MALVLSNASFAPKVAAAGETVRFVGTLKNSVISLESSINLYAQARGDSVTSGARIAENKAMLGANAAQSYDVMFVMPSASALPTSASGVVSRGAAISVGGSARVISMSGSGSGALHTSTVKSTELTGLLTWLDVRYAPQIATFAAVRCDSAGNLADDGESLKITTKCTSAVAMPSGTTLVVSWKRSDGTDAGSAALTLAGALTNAGLAQVVGGGAINKAYSYDITLTLSVDQWETAVRHTSVQRSWTNMHLTKYKTGGVAMGMFSTASEGTPKFECAYPAYFEGGIRGMESAWVYPALTAAAGFEVGNEPYGAMRYKVMGGSLMHLEGSAYVTWDGSNSIVMHTLPEAFRPDAIQFCLSQASGTRLARTTVQVDGIIKVEWVKNVSDASNYTTRTWVQYTFDYYLPAYSSIENMPMDAQTILTAMQGYNAIGQGYASAAQTYANNAATSEATAQGYAGDAELSAAEAAASAGNAATSEATAQGYLNDAALSAAEAAASALAAAKSAEDAANGSGGISLAAFDVVDGELQMTTTDDYAGAQFLLTDDLILEVHI